MHDTINGAMFKEMLLFGTVSIAQAQQAINDLNVFPVPDGDTGTNMSLTIQTAAQELKKIEPATVDQAASVTASALLRCARQLRRHSVASLPRHRQGAQGLQGGRRRGVRRRASGGCRRGV